ncbi:sodium:solute symporter family protein [Candidatus Caldatribacterium sp.]|uniref:sodium:solute symporter family protein n=1 Tax=Candidatus Caldatribacterium sp. TaxID=2282143 RepID=UPI0029985C01|nr:sodium:solute symporter family protein [Candidatus Caldatribacterium sp.]MDW8081175.1 sodium:solute symporter family protein [Candidatus Calescibacterium sp.]
MGERLLLLAIALYAGWGSTFALAVRKGARLSLIEYFLAGRKLHWFIASLSYSATTYSAFMMLGLVGLTYRGGVGALGFELIYLSGLFWAVLVGPKFWNLGKTLGCVSPGEVLRVKYGSRLVGTVYAILSCGFLIPYTSVQLTGIGYLLEVLSQGEISYFQGLLLATFFIILWTAVAGLRSVAVTDSLQAGVMIVSSVAFLLFLVYRFLGGFAQLFHTVETTHPQWLTVPGNGFFTLRTFVNLSLPWFFFSISNPQVLQRLLVPANLREMRKTIVGFLGYGFTYTLITVILGFAALVLLPGLPNPDLATPRLLLEFPIPSWIALFVIVGILSAAVSTADSIILTLSSMFLQDILPERTAERTKLLLAQYVFIPLLCGAVFFFALGRFNLIALLSVTSSLGLLSVVPAILGVLAEGKKNPKAALASMLVGASVALIQLAGVPLFRGWTAPSVLAVAWGVYLAVEATGVPR